MNHELNVTFRKLQPHAARELCEAQNPLSFPRLPGWHAAAHKESRDVAGPPAGRLLSCHSNICWPALCCCEAGLPLAGAQARFFRNGEGQRMSVPLDKASLKLLGVGRGDLRHPPASESLRALQCPSVTWKPDGWRWGRSKLCTRHTKHRAVQLS